MFLSWKILFFHFVFVSLILNFACSISVLKVKRASPLDLRSIVMKFYEKFDGFNARVDQIEAKLDNTFDADKIITDVMQLVNKSNGESSKKFEEIFNTIDENFKNLEKKINKIEMNLNKTEKLEGNLKKVDESLMKSEEKVNKLEFFVSHLLKAFNVCDPNPCLYGGKCQISTTGSGYKCECSKFRSGRLCENVFCGFERTCLIYKDTLYAVVETSLTWAEAKARCEREGMTLAMPKDDERTQYLKDQLGPIYGHEWWLWIGLKQDAGGKGFHWIDGSAMGEYTGGNPHMKSYTGSQFGTLFICAEKGEWHSVSAESRSYPICETRLQ